MSPKPTRPLKAVLIPTIAIVSAVALSACSSGETDPTSGPSAPDGSGSSIEGDIAELTGADTDCLGGGQTIPVGIVVALTGQGAFYGKAQVQGAQLAAAQIEAAGGPTFDLVVKDHKSADAQAGVQAVRELGEAGVRFDMQSYQGIFGAGIAGVEQYQMLTLDGGGGIGGPILGSPYFYGSRVTLPEGRDPVGAKYIAEAFPEVATAFIVQPDLGPENNDSYIQGQEDALGAEGIEVIGTEITPIGTTDFSGVVTKLNSTKPDVIISEVFGDDNAYLAKQLRESGSSTPIIGYDYASNMADVAGDSADGYTFVLDYFLADDPENEWAEYFAATYQEAYPDSPAPGYNEANYYADLVTFWNVVQRLCATGGDVNDPADIMAAFESDPTFPSLFGPGDGKPYGTLTFDLDTHSLAERSLGIFTVEGGAVKRLGRAGIGGEGLEVVG